MGIWYYLLLNEHNDCELKTNKELNNGLYTEFESPIYKI